MMVTAWSADGLDGHGSWSPHGQQMMVLVAGLGLLAPHGQQMMVLVAGLDGRLLTPGMVSRSW